MDKLFFLIGRLHPLLVHLPIGMLFAAFLFELVSRSDRYKKLGVAVDPALLWGALTAIGSVISGYFLSEEGGYEDRLINTHRNFGIATAIFSVLLYFIRKKTLSRISDKKKRKLARIVLFLPLMILLTITGHFGGSLTHGEEFLTEATALSSSTEFIDPAVRIKTITNINEAVLYPEIIQPLLESNCYVCHSSKKQKGQLRLDGIDLILKGGKHGAVIEAGNADSSNLFSRLMLPLEDEHHMPPNEKPQLSSATIDLIRLWINEGADFDQKVKSFKSADKIIRSIQFITNKDASETNWIPEKGVAEANEKTIAKLKSFGVVVLPVSAGSNYLSVTFMSSTPMTNDILAQLGGIKDQLISLRLSYTNISDKEIINISKLEALHCLYLDHTKVSDSAAVEIAKLSNLRYLNLVATPITDKALASLVSLKNLKRIYLFETKVTKEGIIKLLKQLPEAKVDSGRYELPFLPTDTLVHKRKI